MFPKIYAFENLPVTLYRSQVGFEFGFAVSCSEYETGKFKSDSLMF